MFIREKHHTIFYDVATYMMQRRTFTEPQGKCVLAAMAGGVQNVKKLTRGRVQKRLAVHGKFFRFSRGGGGI